VYKGSIRLRFRPQGGQGGDSARAIDVAVYAETVPDEVAAAIFRDYGIPFERGEEYLPVHNAINALVRGDDGGASDNSISGVDPERHKHMGQHPFVSRADASKGVFMVVPVAVAAQGGLGHSEVTVYEGEGAEEAVERVSNGVALKREERERLVREVSDAMRRQLVDEEREMERRMGKGSPWDGDVVLREPLTPGKADAGADAGEEDEYLQRDEAMVQGQLFRMQHPPSCTDR
jgi:hypothetical protein